MAEKIEIDPRKIEYLSTLFSLGNEGLIQKLNKEFSLNIKVEDIFRKKIKREYLECVDKIFNKDLDFYKSTITINPDRLEYMMTLFNLTKDEVLERVSTKLKNPLTEEYIFNTEIKLSNLKKIDKIFNKGLSFYTDPSPPPKSQSSSIFFRKTNFNSELEIGDRELIHKMECRIHSLSALCKLSNYNIKRKIESYTTEDNPADVANKIRQKLYPEEIIRGDRNFLKKLISNFAENGILVLEFVEVWNKKNKTNLDGFFIAPHCIVIKRNQDSFKREIFTLIHELGHYLLNSEEIDKTPYEQQYSNTTEKWCNEFAFVFLSGERLREINDIVFIKDEQIQEISQSLHISRLAIFTYLHLNKVISRSKYNALKRKLEKEYQRKKLEKQQQNQINKVSGELRGSFPQPIYSPLEKDIYDHAYLEGAIDEYSVISSHLNIKDIDEILYG